MIRQMSDIFRAVFGKVHAKEYRAILETVAHDLTTSHRRAIVSSNIQKDALQKFSLFRPMAACVCISISIADGMQHEGKGRELLKLIAEGIHAGAMGIDFGIDYSEQKSYYLGCLGAYSLHRCNEI